MNAIKTLFTAASCACVLAFSSVGCSSSSSDEKEVGTVTAGTYSVHVLQEGSAVAAGATTRFILKLTPGGATSVTGWVGVESGDSSEKKLASYDSGDGDYDDDVVAPTPIPAGAKFWFEIDTAGVKQTGSIDYLK
jgi:hypothetical protein